MRNFTKLILRTLDLMNNQTPEIEPLDEKALEKAAKVFLFCHLSREDKPGYGKEAADAIIQAYLAALPKQPDYKAIAEKLAEALKEMIEVFKDVPEEASMGFDSPPEPKTEWDWNAFLVLSHGRRVLAETNLTTNEGD